MPNCIKIRKDLITTMNDSYKELLVKKERGIQGTIMRVVCVVPTVLLVLLAFTGNLIVFIAAVALCIFDYFVFQWTDIEFEYLYLDKEIMVDKVMAKRRRKRAAVIDVNKIEIMAPQNSEQLSYYKNRQVKTTDLSAGQDLPDQKLYMVYYEGNQCFLLNLDEDFAKTVKSVAPRKVFME